MDSPANPRNPTHFFARFKTGYFGGSWPGHALRPGQLPPRNPGWQLARPRAAAWPTANEEVS